MSNVISGLSNIESVIQHSEIPNLDFITAGPIPPNPSELIQSEELKNIIHEKNLQNDIHLLGFVKDIPSFMNSLDIFLILNILESNHLTGYVFQ